MSRTVITRPCEESVERGIIDTIIDTRRVG